MSSQIDIKIKAYDEASKTIADASNKIKSDMKEVETSTKAAAAAQKETAKSSRELVTGLSGVATSAFSLYGAFTAVQGAQIQVDTANLTVKSSYQSVENAQQAASKALEKYGYGSAEAERATENLSLAQERYELDVRSAQDAQNSLNEKMMGAALQVIPTTITMVDSLGKAWKNMPDVSGLFSKISDGVDNIGLSAKTAAVGVAAFMGGFLIADTILGAIPEDMRQIAGALTATIAVIVAATVAWMAFHGTMTVGVAVPIILAAVGVGIAGIKAAVGFASGGIVKEPTYALIGEAGPEAVVPLKGAAQNLGFDEVSALVNGGVSSISSITALASGGIINNPTVALIGESGPEAVTPWDSGSGALGIPENITVNMPITIENLSSDVDLIQFFDTAKRAASEGIAEAYRRRLL